LKPVGALSLEVDALVDALLIASDDRAISVAVRNYGVANVLEDRLKVVRKEVLLGLAI
jgi:hypothetical protein